MKAIVGLGNPGPEYSATRHNVGFAVVDEVARRWKVRLKTWKAVADLAVVAGRDALLVEPRTFMNASGTAVQQVTAFYKVAPHDVLIIVDEVQLELGRVKLKPAGSAGGHNGLRSIIECLGPDFPRMRIGVERGDKRWDLADHVLAPFRSEERPIIDEAIIKAADAVETFVEDGLTAAMNRFNVRGESRTEEENR